MRCLPGLWEDISLRLSQCGAFYFACTPGVIKAQATGLGAEAKRAHTAERPADAATLQPPDALAVDERADGGADWPEEAEEGDMAQEEVRACATMQPPAHVKLTCVSLSRLPQDDDAGELADAVAVCAAAADELSEGDEAEQAAGEEGNAADANAGEEGQVFRVRTLTIPMSVSNSAPTPDRLQQLLALSDVEEGAPVSLALVDGDGTVIVSHIYRGMVPPEVLETAEGEGDEDAFDDAYELPQPEPTTAAAAAEQATGGADE